MSTALLWQTLQSRELEVITDIAENNGDEGAFQVIESIPR